MINNSFVIRAFLIALIVCITAALSPFARAEDGDIIFIGWFDNFTYGAVNTAIAPVAAGTGYVVNKIRGRKNTDFGIRVDRTGQQFVLESTAIGDAEFSLGAFHVNQPGVGRDQSWDSHESGHNKQSAILGPLYLPSIALSYLFTDRNDEKNSPFEAWATVWGDMGASLQTGSRIGLSFERRDIDGQSSTRLHMSNTLIERTSRLNIAGRYPTAVSYQYGNIDVAMPLGGDCAQGGASLEGTLFRKDFLAEWKIASGFLLLIDAHQETGNVSIDFERKTVNTNLLYHQLGYGFRIGDRRYVAVDLMGRGRYSLSGSWDFDPASSARVAPGLFGRVGVGGETRLHLLDKVEVYGRKDFDWGTGGYSSSKTTFGIETPELFHAGSYTAPPIDDSNLFEKDEREWRKKKRPGIDATRLKAHVYREEETETFPGTNGQPNSTHIKTTWITLKGRW